VSPFTTRILRRYNLSRCETLIQHQSPDVAGGEFCVLRMDRVDQIVEFARHDNAWNTQDQRFSSLEPRIAHPLRRSARRTRIPASWQIVWIERVHEGLRKARRRINEASQPFFSASLHKYFQIPENRESAYFSLDISQTVIGIRTCFETFTPYTGMPCASRPRSCSTNSAPGSVRAKLKGVAFPSA